MKGIDRVLASLVLICVDQGVCQGASNYHLEGPRQADAKIAETPTFFSIEASMIPVTVFDISTNDQLNRAKLHGVALMALARHLNVPSTSEISVSELRPTWLRNDPARVIAEFDVPKSGVRVVQRPSAAAVHTEEPAMHAAETVGESVASPLLTRRGDYLDTLTQLQEINIAAIADIGAPGTPNEKLAGVQQAIMSQFEDLHQVIESDQLLLTIERGEIYVAMETTQQKLSAEFEKARKAAKSTGATPVTMEGTDK